MSEAVRAPIGAMESNYAGQNFVIFVAKFPYGT